MYERLFTWILGAGGSRYELRRGSQSIESFDAPAELDADSARELASDSEQAAQLDADDRGKRGVYSLHAITSTGQVDCPIRLRIAPVNTSIETMVNELFRTNRELTKMLLRERGDEHARFERITKLQGDRLEALEANHMTLLELLDKAKTEDLERTMKVESHKKHLEIKDRMTEAGVPLLAAIVNRFVQAPLLPAMDPAAVTLREVVRSCSPEQVDRIMAAVASEKRPRVGAFFEGCLDGKASTADLRALLSSLDQTETVGVFACLNQGQQAALGMLLETPQAKQIAS